ncbi:MAG: alpha/beta hydrolase [Bifidobacteriaceae bacterium]|jgi:pimeloyl-ACP methyl ester carboxylesterase|nr:alpha/beta hydrolase [Bifidobacteriaceae bacterium]
MTMLAVRAAGSLRGAAPLDGPARDSWAQDDLTSRPSAAGRASAAQTGPLVPAGQAPLVLLHAFPLSSQMWGPMAVDLPELPILAFDLPGAGFSPTLEPATIEAAGRAVIDSLTELGVDRAVVAGVSMGGYVAMSILRDAPERLAGVFLMHTKAEADGPEARRGRLETARQVLAAGSTEILRPMASKMVSPTSRATSPGLVETIEGWIDQATPGGVAWAEQAMAGRPDAMAVLRASGTPASVVAGADDPFATVAQAEAMVDALGPTASLTVLTGVAHLGPLEGPNVTARLLREFYRRVLA